MTPVCATSTSLLVESVSKNYAAAAGQFPVLRCIDLRLTGGEAIAIMGPSGSGKSTLLHILGGLDRPTSGRVRVNGDDISEFNEAQLARFRSRQVGFVFQEHHLLPHCSALENVLIPTLAAGGATTEAESRARALLAQVGLADRLTHRPAELSGGERQRVAIARALMNCPALILCDEPTGNLDRAAAGRVADVLLQLHQTAGAMLIVVTHSTEFAHRLPARCELQDGVLIRGG